MARHSMVVPRSLAAARDGHAGTFQPESEETMSIPNVSRADGNAFIAALNARSLCACATRRQLIQLGTPQPYLPCELCDGTRCIHPGVFARSGTPTEHCWRCHTDVPREQL